MKQELKQHITKCLKYLKNPVDIEELTLYNIEVKYEELTNLLRTFIELSLEDKETQDGTITQWWLYEKVDKIFYTDTKNIDVNKAEDFVNFMIDSSKPVG